MDAARVTRSRVQAIAAASSSRTTTNILRPVVTNTHELRGRGRPKKGRGRGAAPPDRGSGPPRDSGKSIPVKKGRGAPTGNGRDVSPSSESDDSSDREGDTSTSQSSSLRNTPEVMRHNSSSKTNNIPRPVVSSTNERGGKATRGRPRKGSGRGVPPVRGSGLPHDTVESIPAKKGRGAPTDKGRDDSPSSESDNASERKGNASSSRNIAENLPIMLENISIDLTDETMDEDIIIGQQDGDRRPPQTAQRNTEVEESAESDDEFSSLQNSVQNFRKNWDSVDKLVNDLDTADCDVYFKVQLINKHTVGEISDWSAANGLTMMEFKKIWCLISNNHSPLDETHKLAFIECLMPKDNLNAYFVRDILHWLFRKSSGESTEVLNRVLMMLYGWNVYGLVETDIFNNPVTYDRFVLLCTKRRDTIPWLTVLIRKITTPTLIRQLHIEMIYSVIKKTISDELAYFATELIHYYHYLRPDIFAYDEPYMKWSKYIPQFAQRKLPKALKMSLYGAKKRFSNQTMDLDISMEDSESKGLKRVSVNTISKMNDLFFKEFGPRTQVDVDVASIHRLNPMEAMLVLFRKMETLPVLACDKFYLELFNVWATMVFDHRFKTVKPTKMEEYIFILERCICLTGFLNGSLPAVTDWLMAFLPSWDRKLFHDQVHELLRFMPLNIISGECRQLLVNWKSDFATGSRLTRLYIWGTLESIMLRWPEIVKNDDVNVSHEDVDTHSENFFIAMHSIVKGFIAEKGYEDSLIVANICLTYEKIISAYADDKIPVKPHALEELAQMAILCDKIEIFESCSKMYTMLSGLPPACKQSVDSFGFKQEMFRFFAKEEGRPPLIKLFKDEFDTMMKTNPLNKPDVKGILEKLNCFHSNALQRFSKDPSQPFPLEFTADAFNWKELKEKSPNFYRHMKYHCPEIMSRKVNTTRTSRR